jgi:branched-chain amino acid transport system ATP-binding protein
VDATTDLLRVTDLAVHFDGVVALAGVDVAVGTGEIVGLLGPNGAGKTTLFNVITGVLEPTSGTVHLNGREMTGSSPVSMFRHGVARTFQIPEIVADMSVLDNALLGCQRVSRTNPFMQAVRAPLYRSREREARRLALAALEAVGLAHLATQLARELPLGQIRLLELARCIAADAKLLLLDEIASGLSAEEAMPLIPVLRGLVADRGCSVLLVEHNVSWVLEVAERAYVLESGRVLMHGLSAAVRSDPEVIAAYLGTRHNHA